MGYKVNSSRGKSEFDEFIKTVEDAMANGDSGNMGSYEGVHDEVEIDLQEAKKIRENSDKFVVLYGYRFLNGPKIGIKPEELDRGSFERRKAEIIKEYDGKGRRPSRQAKETDFVFYTLYGDSSFYNKSDYDEVEKEIMESIGYNATEADDRSGIESFTSSLALALEKQGSVSVINSINESDLDLGENFKNQLNFIKNSCDLSNTGEVMDELVDAAETLLDNYQLESLTEKLQTDSDLFDKEEYSEEYTEPDDWSMVDEIPVEPSDGENEIEPTSDNEG